MNDKPSPHSQLGLVAHPQHNTQARSTSMRIWARSIGDRNPRYVREAYAPHGAPSFVAHPCWLYSVNDSAVSVGNAGQVSLVAGASWKFERHVPMGECISARSTLMDERWVQGRHAGRSLLQKVLVEYLDAQGSPIASVTATLMRVDPKAAQEGAKYASWTRWKYTPAQLEAIEKDYDAEEVRGAVPRYLDDLQPGEQLPRIVRGPVTSEEMVLFVGATRPIASISDFMQGMREGTVAGFIHPRTGTFETHSAGLIDDESARQLGFPAAHDYGIDRVSQSASLVTNWMGDHGRLRSLDVRLHAPCMLGDATWFTGKLGRIHAHAGERTGEVVVDVQGVNQRGETTLSGTAVVELPLRPRPGVDTAGAKA